MGGWVVKLETSGLTGNEIFEVTNGAVQFLYFVDLCKWRPKIESDFINLNCPATALIGELHWNCSETALKLLWECLHHSFWCLQNRMDLNWSKLFQNCSGTALDLLWKCSESALKVHALTLLPFDTTNFRPVGWKEFLVTAPKLQWNCSETALAIIFTIWTSN